MTNASLFVIAELTVMMVFAGFIFGLAYFVALQRTVHLFAGSRGWTGPLALTLGRIAAAVIFLAFVAKLGSLSLLATFLGFLLARMVALRAVRRTG